MLPLLFACGVTDEPDPPGAGDTTPTLPLLEEVDVLVVGAGPAGTAAALAAQEAGARVLLLDRDDEPGWGLVTGGQAFAVGTRWQAEVGVADSVEGAQAEWTRLTGMDPDTEGVVDFLTHSAETLEWLEGYGAGVSGVYADHDAGVVPRIHQLDWSRVGDGRGLHDALTGELRAQAEVTAPILEDGAVVGVVWTDLATGETYASGARAVVIATGGFARDREEVDRLMPEAAGRRFVVEANYQSDGGGLPFLDAVGAARVKPEQIGIYAHSIQDPEMAEGESVLVIGGENGILVDTTGQRFADETLARSFDLFAALPEGDVYEILAGTLIDGVSFQRPAYNWLDLDTPDILPLDDLLVLSEDVIEADSPEALAARVGIDPDALAETLDAWNTSIYDGVDPFGRDVSAATPLEGDTWVAVRITPGLAKNFGGVATDAAARVLDADGAPISGLYAAGEVAGMILGGGGGEGFSGSVNACYYGGRVAGTQAAGFAAGQ